MNYLEYCFTVPIGQDEAKNRFILQMASVAVPSLRKEKWFSRWSFSAGEVESKRGFWALFFRFFPADRRKDSALRKALLAKLDRLEPRPQVEYFRYRARTYEDLYGEKYARVFHAFDQADTRWCVELLKRTKGGLQLHLVSIYSMMRALFDPAHHAAVLERWIHWFSGLIRVSESARAGMARDFWEKNAAALEPFFAELKAARFGLFPDLADSMRSNEKRIRKIASAIPSSGTGTDFDGDRAWMLFRGFVHVHLLRMGVVASDELFLELVILHWLKRRSPSPRADRPVAAS